MICSVCNGEFSSVRIICGYGAACERHFEELAKRRKAFLDELLAEPIETVEIPDTAAFERFGLKLAVHWLKQLHPESREELAEKNPLLLVPEECALWLKEQILAKLPAKYHKDEEARGHERIFVGGYYEIIRPIPATVLHNALVRAKILKE